MNASPSPPPSRRGARALRWLLLVAALGAGLWFGYRWLQTQWQQHAQREALLTRIAAEQAGLRARLDELARTQAEQAQLDQKNSAEIAALNQRLEQTGVALARLSDSVQGGRARVQLAAVEQLLLAANERALLAHDAAGAEIALAQADERLAALNDPRFFKLRETLAQERAALAAVPKVDLTAATLSLSALIERLPQWPLLGQLPETLTPASQLQTPPEQTWPQRLELALKQALRSLFVVSRNEGGAHLLLPPEQQALVIQIGLLKLEGARLALLRGNTAAFRDLCEGAGRWLRDYFRSDDAGVQAAQAELMRLSALELAPPLPDLSRALELLRATAAAP